MQELDADDEMRDCHTMTDDATKIGRPARTGKDSTRMLRVKLDEDEWADLQLLAESAGESMSEHVRRKVLSPADRAKASTLRRKKSRTR